MLLLVHAVVQFCSTSRLFAYKLPCNSPFVVWQMKNSLIITKCFMGAGAAKLTLGFALKQIL